MRRYYSVLFSSTHDGVLRQYVDSLLSFSPGFFHQFIFRQDFFANIFFTGTKFHRDFISPERSFIVIHFTETKLLQCFLHQTPFHQGFTVENGRICSSSSACTGSFSSGPITYDIYRKMSLSSPAPANPLVESSSDDEETPAPPPKFEVDPNPKIGWTVSKRMSPLLLYQGGSYLV